MGVKFSQLPTTTEVADDDYFAVLDTSDVVLKKVAAENIVAKPQYEEISYQDWLQLSPAQQAATNYYIPDYPNPSNTASQVAYNNQTSGLASTSVQGAIDNLDSAVDGLASTVSQLDTTLTTKINKCEVLVISVPSFNSLPQTVTDTNIEDDMVVVNSVLGTPSSQTGDWTVNTSNGSLTISGTISGSTTLTLYLAKSR